MWIFLLLLVWNHVSHIGFPGRNWIKYLKLLEMLKKGNCHSSHSCHIVAYTI